MLLRTLVISLIAVLLYKVLGLKFIGIPFLPVGTIGTAVTYIGFKNNQAYDRLWEARRLWGGITNTSRNLAVMIIALAPDGFCQRFPVSPYCLHQRTAPAAAPHHPLGDQAGKICHQDFVGGRRTNWRLSMKGYGKY